MGKKIFQPPGARDIDFRDQILSSQNIQHFYFSSLCLEGFQEADVKAVITLFRSEDNYLRGSELGTNVM